ncbi:MAG: alpha-glucosidase/alpha-galactosidase [Thermoprotei archaeon]|nr:MAG: alpha-glucosidase/alpha-galactosidase [Thermoprotei archaeon]RLF25243.1 MAG: alpha-glucosidase/alpha-galactosidase [Thermoprotei archaeon]
MVKSLAEVKICIIGAGSAVFSLSLIRDICSTPNLEGSTISLMDINKERLDAVYALCRRYADEVGMRLRIEKTMDRKEALKDADFVINTALAAGHHRLREGWSIARELGYRYGGSYHIMHDEAFWINFYQFRLFESIINDILDVCPDAWYIQLANPVLAGITYLGRKYREAKIVGICHGFMGVYHIAEVLGLERRYLSFEAPGVNHFIWLTKFYYKGEDAYPLLDEWIEKKAPEYWEKCSPSDDLGPKAVDLYRRFGLFPIGDTCTPGGGAWPYWYHVDDETERRWKEDPARWWNEYFKGLERQVSRIFEIARDSSLKITKIFPPKRSEGSVIALIESLACDIPRIFQVNILNIGTSVPSIPQDFEVEIPALVSKRGVQGIRTTALPKPIIAHILRDRVAPVEVELEAYERGDKDLLLQLIMMDPWTRSEEQARKLLERIMSLPYHEEMRRHYR